MVNGGFTRMRFDHAVSHSFFLHYQRLTTFAQSQVLFRAEISSVQRFHALIVAIATYTACDSVDRQRQKGSNLVES